MLKHTIAAIATPPGKGGIGIVRVSGPAVPNIIQQLFGHALPSHRAQIRAFTDAEQRVLDRGIALYFAAPNSYTGEHVLELQGHGGPVVLNMILQRVLDLGARPANPGEFTETAFLNNRIDLSQAEAVIDLINSGSEQAARAAARTLEGEFSNKIDALLEQLIQLRVYVEAALDFPEEDIDFLADPELKQRTAALLQQLNRLSQAAQQGRLLTAGISIVILGQPNVGKSSLLNCLAGRETAIVTEIAGTTRDVLREHIHIDGLPLHIIDTAGLRDTEDVIEQEGVRRARREISIADAALLVVDDNTANTEMGRASETTLLNELPPQLPVSIVQNKIDISGADPTLRSTTSANGKTIQRIYLSAKTGAGIDLLKQYLKQQAGFTQTGEDQLSARQRHTLALQQVNQHALEADRQLQHGAGELAAEELRLAQTALATITGDFSSEDLLGEIFAGFCIGK